MLETVEVKDYETLNNNKILSLLNDKDKTTIEEYYKNRFPIYYVKKENFNLERELEKYDAGEYWILPNPLCRKDIFEGKIDNIKNLCIPNEKFLKHMFRYNQTLKAFSNILCKGAFKVLEQYNEKDVWNYFKDIYFIYTEKGNNYIGHMDTKTKLDFFPTAYEFQYLTLLKVLKIGKVPFESIRKQTLEFIEKHTGSNYHNIDKNTYIKLVNMGRFDIIDEVFNAKIKKLDSNKRLVIADLFAGEAEWLSLFKKMCYYNDTYIIANEIEFNRYTECKKRKLHMTTNFAFEELKGKIPEYFIDIMLFNPPYGETDGERNVKRFFNMMLENDYLSVEAKVIFILNTDDVLLMYNEIKKYFVLSNPYRITDNEGNRLDQLCFVGNYNQFYEREYPTYDVEEFIDRANRSQTSLLSEIFLDRTQYYTLKDVNQYFDKMKFENNPEMYMSNIESDCWGSVIHNLTIDTFQGKKIKLAEKPRDIGGAANLISSGLINGEIEGKHEHCIAAGISEQTVKSINEDGDIEVVKKSMPFLSVLNAGKIFEITSAKTKDNVIIQDDGTVVVV